MPEYVVRREDGTARVSSVTNWLRRETQTAFWYAELTDHYARAKGGLHNEINIPAPDRMPRRRMRRKQCYAGHG